MFPTKNSKNTMNVLNDYYMLYLTFLYLLRRKAKGISSMQLCKWSLDLYEKKNFPKDKADFSKLCVCNV